MKCKGHEVQKMQRKCQACYIRDALNQHVSRSREASPYREGLHCNENGRHSPRQPSPFREGRHTPRRNSPVMAENSSDCDIPIPIQSIGCQDLLELKCTHCGWLRKRRTLSLFSWPQAYVVLHDGCLYYFKNERSRASAGKFSMYGYNAVYRASEVLPKEAPWSFKIVHSHNKEFKTYFFSASSEQEMKVWMSKIKLEMLHANGKSAIYGKKLQHVKEEKPDKMLDDPSFYQNIEENVYDDSSKFVPSQDYQKQCSIKRINEDSEDEEIETIETNPSIDSRPPLPLPKGAGLNSSIPDTSHFDTPPLPPSTKVPLKPPRIVESKSPVTPPVSRKPPAEPTDASEQNDFDTSGLSKIQKMALKVEKLDNKKATPLLLVSPKPSRLNRRDQDEVLRNSKEYAIVDPKQGETEPRGSYEQTGVTGNNSPGVGRRVCMVPDGSGGGSTGSDDQQSDIEEEWADIYFDRRDKNKANEILQTIGEDGVYLVRPENTGEGMVLVVFVKDHSRKYRIMTENGEYFIHREDFRHKSVEIMIRHYYHNNLPTMSMMLKMPYKLHPAFKKLNL